MKIDMQKLAAEAHGKTMQLMPPPIPFDPPSKKKSRSDRNRQKSDDDDTDSTQYISFDIRIDPKDKNSEKVTRKLKVFEDGTPEEYCKWRIDYDDFITYPAFSKADAKLSLLTSILKGKSRDSFNVYHAKCKADNEEEKAEDKISADKLIEYALNDLAHDIFKVSNAARRQKHYMRNCLVLGGETVRAWGKRLIELNKYFPYFPVDETEDGLDKSHQGLPDDELNDILDRAKPINWHITMLESNLEVQDMSWDDILDYYEKLEMSDAIKKKNNGNQDSSEGHNGKRKRKGNVKDHSGSGKAAKPSTKPGSQRKEACKHCGKWHQVPDSECWTLDKNQVKKPKVSFKGGAKSKSEKSYMTQEEVCKMIAALPMFKNAPNVKKRKVSTDLDVESDYSTKNPTSDCSDSEYFQNSI